jgi:hypothetical protein
MEFTCDSAKQFLLSRLGEQASHDGIAIDEIEQRMFLFSESSGRPDLEANEELDKDYDSGAYESKVAKLLGRAYANDTKTEVGRASWEAALRALGREDFYGLVMVDQARIPRVDTSQKVQRVDQNLEILGWNTASCAGRNWASCRWMCSAFPTFQIWLAPARLVPPATDASVFLALLVCGKNLRTKRIGEGGQAN